MGSELSYKKSGVDIDEGERFVKLISPMAKKTFRPEVLTDIGLFSALFKLDLTKYKEPVLVIRNNSWHAPPIYKITEKIGNISDDEMKKTFNMGIGYIMVVSETNSKDAISLLNNAGHKAFIIGVIEKGGRSVRYS